LPVITPDLAPLPGVIGRADRLVEAAPEHSALVHRLLGRTWFVETLADAVSLSQGEGRGQRFVTRSGQLLEADGALLVGPRRLSEGLVSRRSELRSLRGQIAEYDEQIARLEQEMHDLQARVDREEQRRARVGPGPHAGHRRTGRRAAPHQNLRGAVLSTWSGR